MAALGRYLDLVAAWNARVNLTGARTAGAILDRHLADGFVLAAHLPADCSTLLDVGAGAGFVSVACAVLRPGLRCTLLEPNGKKHTFLRAVARELPLPGVRALRERLEEHLRREDFEPYDAAVSVAGISRRRNGLGSPRMSSATSPSIRPGTSQSSCCSLSCARAARGTFSDIPSSGLPGANVYRIGNRVTPTSR